MSAEDLCIMELVCNLAADLGQPVHLGQTDVHVFGQHCVQPPEQSGLHQNIDHRVVSQAWICLLGVPALSGYQNQFVSL